MADNTQAHTLARADYAGNNLLGHHEEDTSRLKSNDGPKDKPEPEPDGRPAQWNACDRPPNHHGAHELLRGRQGEDTRSLHLSTRGLPLGEDYSLKITDKKGPPRLRCHVVLPHGECRGRDHGEETSCWFTDPKLASTQPSRDVVKRRLPHMDDYVKIRRDFSTLRQQILSPAG